MPKAKKVQPSNLSLNLTAMLDVVFNLIFFFISICNMAGNELPPMDVPHPVHSKATLVADRKKVTVNVIPGEGGLAKMIKVGADDVLPTEIPHVTELLKREVSLNSAIEIDLRVDKGVHYSAVRPVMNSIAAAGIERINLVAHGEGD